MESRVPDWSLTPVTVKNTLPRSLDFSTGATTPDTIAQSLEREDLSRRLTAADRSYHELKKRNDELAEMVVSSDSTIRALVREKENAERFMKAARDDIEDIVKGTESKVAAVKADAAAQVSCIEREIQEMKDDHISVKARLEKEKHDLEMEISSLRRHAREAALALGTERNAVRELEEDSKRMRNELRVLKDGKERIEADNEEMRNQTTRLHQEVMGLRLELDTAVGSQRDAQNLAETRLAAIKTQEKERAGLMERVLELERISEEKDQRANGLVASMQELGDMSEQLRAKDGILNDMRRERDQCVQELEMSRNHAAVMEESLTQAERAQKNAESLLEAERKLHKETRDACTHLEAAVRERALQVGSLERAKEDLEREAVEQQKAVYQARKECEDHGEKLGRLQSLLDSQMQVYETVGEESSRHRNEATSLARQLETARALQARAEEEIATLQTRCTSLGASLQEFQREQASTAEALKSERKRANAAEERESEARDRCSRAEGGLQDARREFEERETELKENTTAASRKAAELEEKCRALEEDKLALEERCKTLKDRLDREDDSRIMGHRVRDENKEMESLREELERAHERLHSQTLQSVRHASEAGDLRRELEQSTHSAGSGESQTRPVAPGSSSLQAERIRELTERIGFLEIHLTESHARAEDLAQTNQRLQLELGREMENHDVTCQRSKSSLDALTTDLGRRGEAIGLLDSMLVRKTKEHRALSMEVSRLLKLLVRLAGDRAAPGTPDLSGHSSEGGARMVSQVRMFQDILEDFLRSGTALQPHHPPASDRSFVFGTPSTIPRSFTNESSERTARFSGESLTGGSVHRRTNSPPGTPAQGHRTWEQLSEWSRATSPYNHTRTRSHSPPRGIRKASFMSRSDLGGVESVYGPASPQMSSRSITESTAGVESETPLLDAMIRSRLAEDVTGENSVGESSGGETILRALLEAKFQPNFIPRSERGMRRMSRRASFTSVAGLTRPMLRFGPLLVDPLTNNGGPLQMRGTLELVFNLKALCAVMHWRHAARCLRLARLQGRRGEKHAQFAAMRRAFRELIRGRLAAMRRRKHRKVWGIHRWRGHAMLEKMRSVARLRDDSRKRQARLSTVHVLGGQGRLATTAAPAVGAFHAYVAARMVHVGTDRVKAFRLWLGHRAFFRWCIVAQASNHRQKAARRVLRHMIHRGLTNAVATWRQAVTDKASLLRSRIARLWIHAKLNALRVWRQKAHRRSIATALQGRAARMIARHCIAVRLARWRQAVRRRIEARERRTQVEIRGRATGSIIAGGLTMHAAHLGKYARSRAISSGSLYNREFTVARYFAHMRKRTRARRPVRVAARRILYWQLVRALCKWKASMAHYREIRQKYRQSQRHAQLKTGFRAIRRLSENADAFRSLRQKIGRMQAHVRRPSSCHMGEAVVHSLGRLVLPRGPRLEDRFASPRGRATGAELDGRFRVRKLYAMWKAEMKLGRVRDRMLKKVDRRQLGRGFQAWRRKSLAEKSARDAIEGLKLPELDDGGDFDGGFPFRGMARRRSSAVDLRRRVQDKLHRLEEDLETKDAAIAESTREKMQMLSDLSQEASKADQLNGVVEEMCAKVAVQRDAVTSLVDSERKLVGRCQLLEEELQGKRDTIDELRTTIAEAKEEAERCERERDDQQKNIEGLMEKLARAEEEKTRMDAEVRDLREGALHREHESRDSSEVENHDDDSRSSPIFKAQQAKSKAHHQQGQPPALSPAHIRVVDGLIDEISGLLN